MNNSDNNRKLTSWKEIANYLGRDIRTCWRWEKTLGLPIHRIDPESPKSRVYAFKDELDEWLGQANFNKINGQKTPRSLAFGKNLPYFAVAVIVVAATLIVILARKNLGSAEPVDFRITGSTLILVNEKGRELWRYDTQIEKLRDNQFYHSRFQSKKRREIEGVINLPWIIIRDINRDQKREVLFCTWTTDEQEGGDLVCFGNQGRELWRFKAGREMWCGSRAYSSHFNIRGFDTLDIDDDGSLETVVISHQTPNWLTQLALLDSNGRIIGEFWNAGHLGDFIFFDLQGDGQKELLTVGLNNEYGKGCLVVFNPRNISGGSPQTKSEFTCRDVKPGTEQYYLLFPRTDVDLERSPVEAINEIYAENPGILSLKTSISDIYFILEFNLNVQDVTISHGFMQKHREARLAGKIQSNLDDPAYKEALIKGVLYYNGREWTTEPTQVVHRE